MPVAPSPSEESRAEDYQVGYRRPPSATQFKPGTSGNPKGRPKGALGLNSIIQQVMTEKVPVQTTAGLKKMSKIEAIVHKLFELALAGDMRALSNLLDRYDAAVPEVPAETPRDAEPEDERLAVLKGMMNKFLTGGYAEPDESDDDGDSWSQSRT